LAGDLHGYQVERFARTATGWAYSGAIPDPNVAPPLADDAAFNVVRDVAVGPDGSLNVMDYYNNRLVRFAADGSVLNACGNRRTTGWPKGVAVDQVNGDIWYPAGVFNRVDIIRPDCSAVASIQAEPFGFAALRNAQAIAIRNADRFAFVADTGNSRLVAIDMDTRQVVASFGAPGTGTNQFRGPRGLSIDPLTGHLLIADTGNNRIVEVAFNGTAFSWVGTRSGGFAGPEGVAIDNTGRLYVADTGNDRVLVYGVGGDQVALIEDLRKPAGVTVEPLTGEIFISDQLNDLVRVYAWIPDAVGPACGPPAYSSAAETGVFLWQDCADPQQWRVRFTAGGQSVSYRGSVSAEAPFESMAGVSQEASDVLTPAPFATPTAGPIGYVQNVGATGFDGFDFRVGLDGEVCFAPTSPTNRPVYLGADRVLATTPISLRTFGACGAVPVVPALSIGDVTVGEGEGSASFPVTLSASSTQTVTVAYASSDGTALAGADYTAVSGVLTFAPGQTVLTVSVPILDDAVAEPAESFSVVLSGAVGATLSKAVGAGTILDDDGTAGPACGAPVYNSATETGVFLWQDCADPQQWRVRFTAGGQSVSYRGIVSAEAPFESLAGVSQEASDVLTPAPFATPTAGPIEYVQNVGATGFDGFDFRVAADGEVCFAPTSPTNRPVLIGAVRLLATTPISLRTFQACEP
jgi:hypothetical protein